MTIISFEKLIIKSKPEDWVEPACKQFFLQLINTLKNIKERKKYLITLFLANIVKSALRTNAIINDGFHKHPQIQNITMVKPVFIVGPPRTGTTILHHMFGALPEFNTLSHWEMTNPPKQQSWLAKDLAITSAYFTFFILKQIMGKEFLDFHPMSLMRPQECTFMLQNAGILPSIFTAFPLSHAIDLYSVLDATAAYQYHKKHSQYILFNQKITTANNTRMIFKDPHHANFLTSINHVYPDAIFICTHRDPLQTVYSTCRLAYYLRKFTMNKTYNQHNKKHFGAEMLQLINLLLQKWFTFSSEIQKKQPDRIINISQKELKQNPEAVFKNLYHTFDLQWQPQNLKILQKVSNNISKNEPKTSNDHLEDFGIEPEKIKNALAWYYQAYAEYL